MVAEQQKYGVSAYEPEAGGAVIFTFIPIPNERRPVGIPRSVPQYVVAVRETSDRVDFDWSGSPNTPEPGEAKKIEEQVALRMQERRAWITRVTELVTAVESWARELGWSTKRVEKKIEDARVGTHRVPALLMQEETFRILLEPVGRSTPGTEGVVDLYLMPAYDDIASICYYGGRWNLRYVFSGDKPVATVDEADALPLSKEVLERVLAEMKQHAL